MILDTTFLGAVALAYAEASRSLRERGERIGDNDLWIAATALANSHALVTRNRNDFRRIEHIQLLFY